MYVLQLLNIGIKKHGKCWYYNYRDFIKHHNVHNHQQVCKIWDSDTIMTDILHAKMQAVIQQAAESIWNCMDFYEALTQVLTWIDIILPWRVEYAHFTLPINSHTKRIFLPEYNSLLCIRNVEQIKTYFQKITFSNATPCLLQVSSSHTLLTQPRAPLKDLKLSRHRIKDDSKSQLSDEANSSSSSVNLAEELGPSQKSEEMDHMRSQKFWVWSFSVQLPLEEP